MAFITWAGKANVGESANSTLTKAGGTSGFWDAGAHSAEYATAGQIRVQITIDQLDKICIIGLSNAADAEGNVNFNTIDYAVFPFSTTLYVAENGNVINTGYSFGLGDEIGVQVTSDGKVQYFINENIVREIASPVLNYPLRADCSIEKTGSTLANCQVFIEAVTEIRGEVSFQSEAGLQLSPKVQSPLESEIRGNLDFEIQAAASFAPEVFTPHIRAALNFQPQFALEFQPQIRSTPGLNFRIYANFLISPKVGITLAEPEPITPELPETAFSAEMYAARLYVNNSEVKIRSFQFSKAKGAVGANLNVTLANPDRAQIAGNPAIKFEIGKRTGGVWTYHTLIDSSLINSESYSLSFSGDNLSFSTASPLSEKLSASPKRNIIVYSSSKLTINTDDLEPISIAGGGQIVTQVRPFSILTLYNLLNIAFVEGCGFSSFETNIPNFEVNRCDFDYKSTFLEAVAGYIGVFEPLFFAVGNVLWIIDKTQAIPENFTAQILPKARITGISARTQNNQIIDGYEIQYLSTTANGTTQNVTKTYIKYYPGFSIETTETIKYWKDSNGEILNQQTIRKRDDKKADFTLATQTVENTFDGQGKKTLVIETKQGRVPDLNNYPNRALQTTAENRIEYTYATDPRNFRRVVPREIITQEKKLIAVDSDNKYLEQNFTQDIEKADDAGNIVQGMTSAFVPTKTKIETFTTKKNGQIERTFTVFDHLRGKATDDDPDTRTGDISLNGELSEARKLTVFRSGVTLASKKNPISVLAIGAMPLQFGKSLAERKLVRQFSRPFDATVEVPGYDENLDRGVYFSLPDRNGILGNFLTEGLTVSGDDQNGITTGIETTQVLNG